MSLNAFLFSVCWIMLCLYKLKYCMHMLQLEGYKNEKYIDWMNTHKDKIYSQRDKIYTSILIAMSIVFMLPLKNSANFNYFEMIGSLLTAVYLIINSRTMNQKNLL